MTPAEVDAVPTKDRATYIPYSFGLGAPPTFEQPHAGIKPPGLFTPDVSAVRVDRTCEETSDAVAALNRRTVPTQGYDELMVVVPSSGEGAEVRGFTINYDVGGNSFSLHVPWTMVVCDSARTLPHC
ncbi:MAG: hypothetical protein JWN91_740 [Nocardioides sp.]|nr:hypothetical protein [Nocardioides sp.]